MNLKHLLVNEFSLNGGFMNRKNLTFVFIFFIFILGFPCFALYNAKGIPDSSEIRKNLVESWFTCSIADVRANKTELHINNIGKIFQVRAEENGSDILIIVAPQEQLEVDVYSEVGKHTTLLDVFPADMNGSWVLFRDINSGKPLQIRYYFTNDSDVYIQLSPADNKTFVDFIIYNSYAVKGVPVGIPFEKLYTASFSDIYTLTKNTLPWNYTNIIAGLYNPILQMIAVIRENQSRFFYAENGAYNENGEAVYITTNEPRDVPKEILEEDGLSFSSAGFLKWIVDGLVIPLAGSYTKIEPLIVPTEEYSQGSFADILSHQYNLSFSLDWTRNLAAAALSVYSGKNYYFHNSGCDVKIEPFSSEKSSKGWVNSTGYTKGAGYKIETLKPLLYVLAATEPGRFFLGAIQQTDSSKADEPEIHFFTESVAVFPYFDSNGKFQVSVFEKGQELTLDAFIKKYSGSHIHFVRINASERFFPQ